MKVLFAVNNDDISNAILKKYQKNYKEILSYKNVYYFNAIIKELQKDKTYDRIIISEDLEPFANNNYDAIDRFLVEKLNKISAEVINQEDKDIDVVFICSDRRTTEDNMLSKFLDMGIYGAILGQDRSTDEVCKLIYKPRTKKEAKQYYKVEMNDANYQYDNENGVSESEVENIVAHYKRLEKFGKNEDKYLDSFNNIVSQYNDEQLKIIIRYLPISVKAVLEEKSSKYQQLVSFNSEKQYEKKNARTNRNKTEKNKKTQPIQIEMLEKESDKSKITKPIVIPAGVNKEQVRKLIKPEKTEETKKIVKENEEISNNINSYQNIEKIQEETTNSEPKRGRGRPRKNPIIQETTDNQEDKTKRGRGRPRKNPIIEETEQRKEEEEFLDLFNIDTSETDKEIEGKEGFVEESIDLFDLETEEETNVEDNSKQNRESAEEDIDLFGMLDQKIVEEKNNQIEDINLFELETTENKGEVVGNLKNEVTETQYKPLEKVNLANTLTKDKKIVCFVGTTKNGTSFIVNNTAHLLSSMGISTAILDMTKTKNAYYIYTNSEEQLMKTAKDSINKLKSGITEGIRVNKNLTVYTSLPEDHNDYTDVDNILSALTKNYSVVLIDCDFDTPMEYFGASQEIYLVQSMDVLTIQPLTAFLRNMQSKGVLRQEKLKIIINKSVNIRSVSIKTLIGGISKYNDPSMTYMKDLFDKDKVPYCTIPFEMQNYIKYLDALITCTISLNGYTKSFVSALKQLCGMIYPLINRQTYSPRGDKYKNTFSSEMNDTLNKMKRKYN